LRKSILVLATAVAVGATVPHSSSAFEDGGGRNSGYGSFGGGGHMSHGHRGGDGGNFGNRNGDQMSGGYGRRGRCDGLVGGTFALPYCDYCTRHGGDRSC
jgi:hypothetical protein